MLSRAEIAWRNRVTNLLGPPIEIDFEKEAARRALRKPMPAADPSSGRRRAQTPPLRAPVKNVNAKTEGDAARRVDSSLSSLQRPNHPCNTLATKQVQSETVDERNVLQKDLALTSVSREAPEGKSASQSSNNAVIRDERGRRHEQKRRRVNVNSGGWISRGTFYKDDNARRIMAKAVGEVMSSEKRSHAAFDHDAAVGEVMPCGKRSDAAFNQNAATGTKESVERSKQLGPLCDSAEKQTRNHSRTRLNSPGKDDAKYGRADHRLDSSAWESPSPVKRSQKRNRASLFPPIAKRANRKFKQTSLHMFAKVVIDFK